MSSMLLVGVRDTTFRLRRFVIAILVTALIFGIALVLEGVKRSVRNETTHTVALFHADGWVVAKGVQGPFTAPKLVPANLAGVMAAKAGVQKADPVVLARATATDHGDITNVNLVGVVPGGLGDPSVTEGHTLQRSGEAVVDTRLGYSVGDRIDLGTLKPRVVGESPGLRYNFGASSVYVTLPDAQQMAFEGAKLAMAIAVAGHATPPKGYAVLGNSTVVSDLRRITDSGVSTINFVSILLWFGAVGIVGLIVYLSAVERTRDFAVLKATGASNRTIVGSIALQSVVLSIVAATLAIGVAYLMRGGLPFPASIELGAILRGYTVAIVVGVLASFVSARRAFTTDPALAFGG